MPDIHEVEKIKTKSQAVLASLKALIETSDGNADSMSMTGGLVSFWATAYAKACKGANVVATQENLQSMFMNPEERAAQSCSETS